MVESGMSVDPLSECLRVFVDCAVNDVQLLFAGELNEIDRVSGDTDGQLGIFFWVVHRVDKGLPINNIDVDVMPFVVEINV